MSRFEPTTNQQRPERTPVMPAWVIWAGAVTLLVIASVSVFVLLSLFGGGTEQDKIRLEVIKLAGSIVIGTGGAVALLLAARRQRTTELDLAHKAHTAALDHAQRERVAAASERDAAERRINDQYTAATEQLGSDKAPVRLAGLHALDWLGHHYPDRRQTVIDVFCSYLCMPFTLPGATAQRRPASTSPRRLGLRPPARRRGTTRSVITDLRTALGSGSHAQDVEGARQELKVRLTAQRLITDHLRPNHDKNGNPTDPKFWNNIDLDLTNATLIDWNMEGCHAGTCRFDAATFHGPAKFEDTTFQAHAQFASTSFNHDASFSGATFQRGTVFSGATFHGRARFNANFQRSALFDDTTFQAEGFFEGASFQGHASFLRIIFQADFFFRGAKFQSRALFADTVFQGDALFGGATFPDDVEFFGAAFHASALFYDVDFRCRLPGVRDHFRAGFARSMGPPVCH